MLTVYKSATELNVKITDDIRGVFDRMLATDQEIAQVKSELDDYPMADGYIESMPPKLQEKYTDLVEEAHFTAVDNLNQKQMQDLEKRKSKTFTKRRAEIKKEVTAEMLADHSFNAMSILKRGKLADGSPLPAGMTKFKLNSEQLKKELGEESVDKGGTFKSMSKKDGMDLDMAANMLGFGTKKSMLNVLGNIGNMKDMINYVTENRLEVEFPSLMNTEELSEFASHFYHNDKRAARIRFEMEYMASEDFATFKKLTKRIAKRVAPNSTVRTQAKAEVGRMANKDLKPNTFKQAERKAANDAAEAWGKGEWEKAFDFKQKELFNHYLYLESSEAKTKVEKSLKDYKKFFKKDEDLAKTREMNFINAARAILSQYGIGDTRRSQAKPAMEYLKTMSQYDEEGFAVVVAMAEQIMQVQKPFKELTYDEFLDVNEGVQALWDLSKSSKEVEVGGKKILITDAVELLTTDMQKFKKPREKKKYKTTASFWDETKEKLMGMKALGRRLEHWVDVMDLGDINGNFRTFMFNEISEATDKFMLLRSEYQRRFVSESEKVDFTREPIQSDELGFEFKNKAELLGAIIHIGNDSNKRKLLLGREWGSENEDGTLNDTRWEAFRTRMHEEGVLTKEDYDYIQSLWDMMEEVKPLAQKAHKKLFGFYFGEITHQEFETPFGTYKGGYAPAKIDPNEVRDVAEKNALEEFIKGNPSYNYPASGGKGFTIGRVEFNKPLKLDIRIFNRHMNETLRFAIVKPPVVDAAKVVMNNDFKTEMGDIDPTVIQEMIIPALSRADKNSSQSITGKGPNGFLAAGNYLRKTAAMQIMFANVVNTIEQFTGLIISLTKVDNRQMAKSLFRYTSAPKETVKLIAEKSQYMRGRFDTQQFELETNLDALMVGQNKAEKIKGFAERNAYIMQQITQGIVDAMVWDAAYNSAVEEGLNEVQSVKKSDAAVRLTQGSARALDVSRIEANPYIRFFQMFMGYFNMLANLNAAEYSKIYHSELGLQEKYKRGFMTYLYAFAVPAILSAALRKAAGGSLDEEDDGEVLDDMFDVFFGAQFRQMTAMVPVIGGAVEAGVNKANDKFYDDRVSASPAVTVVTALAGAPFSAGKAIATGKGKKGATRDVLTAVGVIFGVPTGPLAKPIGYALDINEGKKNPTGPIDAARGYITGK